MDNRAKTRHQKLQQTFEKIYYGETSNLECPYCLSRPLRFSFTFIEPNKYGIWISCSICGKEAHLQLIGRPPGYNESYVLKAFQERDEQATHLIREERKKWRDVVSRKTRLATVVARSTQVVLVIIALLCLLLFILGLIYVWTWANLG
jgi:hypothetical protein